MANIELKAFLDYEGLALYDELIKAYIDAQKGDTDKSTAEVLKELNDYVAANDARNEANEEAIAANKDAIDLLNSGKDVEGSVLNTVNTVVGEATEKAVDDAIKALVDNAPEALDTLKEIADWIANDETGTAALIKKVDDQIEKEAQDIADLKEYVDAQDEYYWNHIGSIALAKVTGLFAVAQKEDESVADAIAANSSVKLIADQTVTEDIVITGDKYIDANGATFEGQVTVPAGANVVIENATFAKPVIVA